MLFFSFDSTPIHNNVKKSIWYMLLKMLLDSVKHDFSFGNPVQAVNKDDFNVENAIKDRTG